MRVAIFVLGVALLGAGSESEAAESIQNPAGHRAMAAPPLSAGDAYQSGVMLRSGDAAVRNGLGVMGFVPAQNPSAWLRGYAPFGDPRDARQPRFDPARIPLPANRTSEDHWLTAFIAVMLIAYQLRRKHRFLRPHQFST